MFGNKKDKDKRFDIITQETVYTAGITVIRDSQTGVNYLVGQGVNGFAITPLLDKDGKPLVTLLEDKHNE